MRFGPAVRLLIHQHGLNPASIKATGPRGTLLKSDVLAVLASGAFVKSPPVAAARPPPPKPAAVKPGLTPASSPFADFSLSNLRRQMGASIAAAKFTLPHAYQSVDIDLTRIDANIKTLITKKSPPQFNHYLRMACIVKHVASALGKVKLSDAVKLNLNDVAVAFPQPDGSESLTTLRRVGAMNVADIATFLQGTTAGTTPESSSDASVSFHTSLPEPVILRRFAAVVRPPQVAAVSVTKLPPVIVPSTDGDKKIKLAPFYSVTLSYDCSKVDDAAAASLLNAVANSLTMPGL